MNDPTSTSVRVLGAVHVVEPSGSHDVPSRRQRALLAALALRRGNPVAVSDLVDAVWDDEPPERARTTLQTYVSRLRRSFGPIIDHGPGGYRLAAGVATDVDEVRSIATRLEHDPPASADARAQLALRGLECWNGPALADLRDDLWFAGSVGELDELRARLVDLAADALVASGRASAAVSLIEACASAGPAREPTQVLLVRALHAAGRTTEALRAASRYRAWLREETGLTPGSAFVGAERAALSGEPAQAQPAAPVLRAGATLARPTPLIGREAELQRLRAELAANRLVTVTGAGGVGKTRLVAELVAGHTDDGWIVVELAPIEQGGVASALAAAVGYRADVADERGLSELLRSSSAVLVLDNCEHVVAETRRLVRRLLDACPDLQVLTTTRTRLELPEERVIRVTPLPADARDSPAVRLFLERLSRSRPDFDPAGRDELVAEICARLEGLPLALELAASRAAAFGLDALAARLDDPIELLVSSSDRSGRHATLANVIEWSVDLLDPPARRVLAALSVFHGTFDVDAAERIGEAVVDEPVAPLVGRLLDASLLAVSDDAGRFRLLEMIRDFAAIELEELALCDPVRRAHASWVADELGAVATDSTGSLESATSARLDRLRVESEAAIAWAGGAGDVEMLAALTEPLATPLLYRPDRELVLAVLDASQRGTEVSPTPPPSLLAAGARCAFLLGDLAHVERLAHTAIDAAADGSAARHRAAHALGVVRLYQGRFAESQRWFERVTGDVGASIVDRMDALGGLGLALCYLGDRTRASETVAQLDALADLVGSATYRAFAHYMTAEIALAEGDVDDALTRLGTASELAWSVGATFVWGIASTVLAAVLVRHRPAEEARRHLPLLIERWRRTATWPQLWTTLRLVAELIRATGHADVALLVLEAADRDPASPTPVGDDADRVTLLRAELEADLGPAMVTGVVAAAAAIDRVTVLDRAVDALTG